MVVSSMFDLGWGIGVSESTGALLKFLKRAGQAISLPRQADRIAAGSSGVGISVASIQTVDLERR